MSRVQELATSLDLVVNGAKVVHDNDSHVDYVHAYHLAEIKKLVEELKELLVPQELELDTAYYLSKSWREEVTKKDTFKAGASYVLENLFKEES